MAAREAVQYEPLRIFRIEVRSRMWGVDVSLRTKYLWARFFPDLHIENLAHFNMSSISGDLMAIASLRGPLRTASPTGHCPGPGRQRKGILGPSNQDDESSTSSDGEDAPEVPSVPSDCMFQILQSLDKNSIACFSLVCKRWRDLCRQQALWQHRFMVSRCMRCLIPIKHNFAIV